MTEEKPSEVIDIKTREKLTAIPTDPDTKPGNFLTTWKKFCKDTKVKTIMILTIDENQFVTWGFLADNDHHRALAALTLEDLREEIKDDLFGDFDLGDLE